jgi:5,6,7,8-tetrahydromethanopterin hydro-lyase
MHRESTASPAATTAAGSGHDGAIGEGWGGEGIHGCHVNLVLAHRGSPTAAAAALALAGPSPGHVPFLVCAGGGTVVRPATVFVNKTTLDNPGIERLTWGAAQIGIARAVLDALAEGVLDRTAASANPSGAPSTVELVLLVACWLDPAAGHAPIDADVETTVCTAAREAMLAAIRDAVRPADDDGVDALVAGRNSITNGFYGGS